MRLTAIALLGMATAAFARAGEDDAAPPPSPDVTTVQAAGTAPPIPAGAPNPPTSAVPPPRRPDERSMAARATRGGIVLELRSDFGFTRYVHVEFSNERRVSMQLNDGLGISAGVSFLPLAKGQLATRVTGGFKLARLRASNGAALFTAFPLELMEMAYVGPLRLGAGLSVLVAPRVSGDGLFEPVHAAFGPAPGAVADAEWIVSPRTRTGIGVRASWNRFAAESGAHGAPAIGLVVRSDFDVTGR